MLPSACSFSRFGFVVLRFVAAGRCAPAGWGAKPAASATNPASGAEASARIRPAGDSVGVDTIVGVVSDEDSGRRRSAASAAAI
ncbi:MAG: hypothetical protein JXA11_16900 [Phycisphaerae bacterium]|nr:hypothetical protein [Phycisphaerae bacterium]